MRSNRFHRPLVAVAAAGCALVACGLQFAPYAATATAQAPTSTVAAPRIPVILPSETTAATVAATASPTSTPTATATPESTATSSGPLVGTVLQKSNCRYGPGASYLYKTGMPANAMIEVVGRTIDGGWVNIQSKGAHNRCWINAKLIQTAGDIMSLPDSYKDSSSLPRTADYGPTTITGVSGGGGSVTVDWSPVVLPDYAMVSDIETEYVVEVWTCRNGEPAFYSLGTNETSMTFDVDGSCGQPSRADVAVQIKTGVSGVTEIALP